MHPLFLDMRGADWTSNESFTLRPQASRFEDWENPYALMLGARAALTYANEIGFPTIEGRTIKLAEILRSKLQDIPGIKLLDRGLKKAAIVTLSVPNFEPGKIKTLLNQHQVNCSIVSKVSARLDFEEKGVNWALRFSPHYYNTEKEIGRVVETMASLIPA
jgi:selenocysteine lyase/cysteine desulfurase